MLLQLHFFLCRLSQRLTSLTYHPEHKPDVVLNMHHITCVVLFLPQVSTAQEIIRHFEGQPADLVVCDGAPDGENLTSSPVFISSEVSCVFLAVFVQLSGVIPC